MTSADATRLAVLIDADNTTASVTTELLEEIAKYGTSTIRRAYGDWTTPQLAGWKEQLLRHAIQRRDDKNVMEVLARTGARVLLWVTIAVAAAWATLWGFERLLLAGTSSNCRLSSSHLHTGQMNRGAGGAPWRRGPKGDSGVGDSARARTANAAEGGQMAVEGHGEPAEIEHPHREAMSGHARPIHATRGEGASLRNPVATGGPLEIKARGAGFVEERNSSLGGELVR